MKRIIIIIPANKCDAANKWLELNIGEEAKGTFIPSINASGRRNDVATHAICSWQLSGVKFDAVTNEFSKPSYQAELAEGMPYLDSPTQGRTTGRLFMKDKGLKRRNEDRG